MAGGDAAEVLQLEEEPLEQIALAVKPLAEAGRPALIAPWRNVGRGALVPDHLGDAVSFASLADSAMARAP